MRILHTTAIRIIGAAAALCLPASSWPVESLFGADGRFAHSRVASPFLTPSSAWAQGAAPSAGPWQTVVIRSNEDATAGNDGRPAKGQELVVTDAHPGIFDKAQALGFDAHVPTKLHGLGFWVTTVSVPSGSDIEEVRRSLQQQIPGARVGLNQTYQLYRPAKGQETANLQPGVTSIPRSPGACPETRCFGPPLIGWHPAMSACAKGVRIGVIDTAADLEHGDFRGNRISVGTFSNNRAHAAPRPHGTGILALLGGARSNGTPGLVPNADFYVADVFFADAKGYLVSDTATLLRALNWLDMFQVKVVNMSLSGSNDSLLESTIAELSRKKGMIFVAAAGNEGPAGPPSYPAAYKDVIAVTAVGRDLRGYRYASHGNYVDVAAPGVDIWTALPGGEHGFQSGTSFAVPYVTAVAAAMYRSIPIKRKSELLRRLTFHDLGIAGRDPIYGRGLIIAPDTCAPPQTPQSGPLVGRGPTVLPIQGKAATRS